MSTFKNLQLSSFSSLLFRVQARYKELLADGNVFLVELEHNQLFDAYLQAFAPEDRQEHNCSCCRHFLRDVGGLVSVTNGEIKTLWDFEIDGRFVAVPGALQEIVRNAKITRKFLSSENRIGVEKNFKLMEDSSTKTFNHFFVNVPSRFQNSDLGLAFSMFTAQKETTQRSLTEISLDSVETVLELIGQNSLYRGTEFKNTLVKFQKAKKLTENYTQNELELYAIEHHAGGLNIRNSVIGTLLTDLSEGRDLDSAVSSYESKVAPSNYKRPTALVTPRMLKDAETKLTELGLLSSFHRRHATELDVPVEKVLFAHRKTFKVDTANSLFDVLAGELPIDVKSFAKVEEVPYNTFVENVLPGLTSVEVLMESRLQSNLMNLLTAADAEAPLLFSWDSPISWSYINNMTDSVKERVKAAGGSVEGELRVTLEWFNFDDLDLHVIEPNGNRISFHNKCSNTGGFLDVDMNVSPNTREPVENVIFKTTNNTLGGVYTVIVNNYTRRESIDVGFNIQIECRGKLYELSYDKAIPGGKNVEAGRIHYSKVEGIKDVTSSLPFKTNVAQSKEIWNIKTNTFVPVDLILFSPNHWEGNEVGNQHLFFMMPDARNPEDSRGLYNEFYKNSLQPHRKALELLGNKTKVSAEGRQMAGLGFSLTQRNYLYCKISGKTSRVIKLIF